MKFISALLYLLNMVFTSFILYVLVMCLFFETTQVKILILEILNFVHVINYHAEDVAFVSWSGHAIMRAVCGKYAFMYYALQGTLIFMVINMFIYITGIWKAISKLFDGYQNYEIISGNDPVKNKLFQVLDEIRDSAKAKLDIDLPDYHKFTFEKEKDSEGINFHITPTQVLRPTNKTLRWLTSSSPRENDIFKAVVAHEIGHFVNKDTELLQFQSGTNMLASSIKYIFEKISPKKLQNWMLKQGADIGSSAGCFGLIISLPFLLIALFLWIVFIPGVICLKVDELVSKYFFNPLITLTGRGQEYKADAFAVKIGYGQGLFDLFPELDKCHGSSSGRGFSWSRFFNDTHPTNYSRQKKINELMTKLGGTI